MRKIIISSFITLDGVIQAPGQPEEDMSGGFEYGGWIAPYGDDVFNQVLSEQMKPADLLLGRITFDIWEAYWPQNAGGWQGINEVTKYVVSRTRKSSDWQNSVFLDNVEAIKKLKNTTGSNILVWGSSVLIQTLLEHDLVDELWLKIFPLTLGKGKKLFGDGPIAAAFTLMENTATPKGVIMANYKRVGEVRTGTVGW